MDRVTAPPAPAPDLGRLEELASKARDAGNVGTDAFRREERRASLHRMHEALDPATVSWLVARARRAEELEREVERLRGFEIAQTARYRDPGPQGSWRIEPETKTEQGAPHDD